MISFVVKPSPRKAENYLRKISRGDIFRQLDGLAQKGVDALATNTPVETGLAAISWAYEIETNSAGCTISWKNTDVETGFPVAIMLQYGYATGTGGYVQGVDYINPAMKPIFDQIADKVWKAVTSA